MKLHKDISNTQLQSLIKIRTIRLGGNKTLKIYRTLTCKSGKRMNKDNRVFFDNIHDAEAYGYRPCGHCMKLAYQEWKKNAVNEFRT